MFLPRSLVKINIVGSLHYRELACLASDRQDSTFESCVWRAVSSQLSHHPHEVLLDQFSPYVHKGGLKPHSLHFVYMWSGVKLHFPFQIYEKGCIFHYGRLLGELVSDIKSKRLGRARVGRCFALSEILAEVTRDRSRQIHQGITMC